MHDRSVGRPMIEVVAAGAFSTVQDHPGRVGYWMVAVSYTHLTLPTKA